MEPAVVPPGDAALEKGVVELEAAATRLVDDPAQAAVRLVVVALGAGAAADIAVHAGEPALFDLLRGFCLGVLLPEGRLE